MIMTNKKTKIRKKSSKKRAMTKMGRINKMRKFRKHLMMKMLTIRIMKKRMMKIKTKSPQTYL